MFWFKKYGNVLDKLKHKEHVMLHLKKKKKNNNHQIWRYMVFSGQWPHGNLQYNNFPKASKWVSKFLKKKWQYELYSQCDTFSTFRRECVFDSDVIYFNSNERKPFCKLSIYSINCTFTTNVSVLWSHTESWGCLGFTTL